MRPTGIIIIIKTDKGDRLLNMTAQEEQRVQRAVISTYGRNLRVQKEAVSVVTATRRSSAPEPPPAEEPKEEEPTAPIVENPFTQPEPEPTSEPSAEPEPEKPKRQYRRKPAADAVEPDPDTAE